MSGQTLNGERGLELIRDFPVKGSKHWTIFGGVGQKQGLLEGNRRLNDLGALFCEDHSREFDP